MLHCSYSKNIEKIILENFKVAETSETVKLIKFNQLTLVQGKSTQIYSDSGEFFTISHEDQSLFITGESRVFDIEITRYENINGNKSIELLDNDLLGNINELEVKKQPNNQFTYLLEDLNSLLTVARILSNGKNLGFVFIFQNFRILKILKEILKDQELEQFEEPEKSNLNLTLIKALQILNKV